MQGRRLVKERKPREPSLHSERTDGEAGGRPGVDQVSFDNRRCNTVDLTQVNNQLDGTFKH